MANKQRKYTPEFRRQMVELVQAGRKFADLENVWLHGLVDPAVGEAGRPGLRSRRRRPDERGAAGVDPAAA